MLSVSISQPSSPCWFPAVFYISIYVHMSMSCSFFRLLNSLWCFSHSLHSHLFFSTFPTSLERVSSLKITSQSFSPANFCSECTLNMSLLFKTCLLCGPVTWCVDFRAAVGRKELCIAGVRIWAAFLPGETLTNSSACWKKH